MRVTGFKFRNWALLFSVLGLGLTVHGIKHLRLRARQPYTRAFQGSRILQFQGITKTAADRKGKNFKV